MYSKPIRYERGYYEPHLRRNRVGIHKSYDPVTNVIRYIISAAAQYQFSNNRPKMIPDPFLIIFQPITIQSRSMCYFCSFMSQ